MMKRIEAIVRPAKVNDVYKALEQVGHPGLMISEIEGHGIEKRVEQQIRGKTYKVDLITKARIELVVSDDEVDNAPSTMQYVCAPRKGERLPFASYANEASPRMRTLVARSASDV
jgi:nitrogen regulatory protein PII